jgi:hypothetical protein
MGKKKPSGQVNISCQDRQFNSHISYLFKVSFSVEQKKNKQISFHVLFLAILFEYFKV